MSSVCARCACMAAFFWLKKLISSSCKGRGQGEGEEWLEPALDWRSYSRTAHQLSALVFQRFLFIIMLLAQSLKLVMKTLLSCLQFSLLLLHLHTTHKAEDTHH